MSDESSSKSYTSELDLMRDGVTDLGRTEYLRGSQSGMVPRHWNQRPVDLRSLGSVGCSPLHTHTHSLLTLPLIADRNEKRDTSTLRVALTLSATPNE